jgi:hypothetical protein
MPHSGAPKVQGLTAKAPTERSWLWLRCASSSDTVREIKYQILQFEVVGNHTEPDLDLTLHPGIAFVSAAVEPVPPLDHADAALAPGPPFLPIAELTLLLLAFALGALGRAIGDADAFDTHTFAVSPFLVE